MNFHTPYPPKILITPIRGSKTYLICHSLSIRRNQTQNSTNFNLYQIISQMQQLTYTPTENQSTNIHENQQSIYDINIQRQEINKGIHKANTLQVKLSSQQKTNILWLVTTTNAILKTLIQKSENTIFLFRRTQEAEVRNIKILVDIKR